MQKLSKEPGVPHILIRCKILIIPGLVNSGLVSKENGIISSGYDPCGGAAAAVNPKVTAESMQTIHQFSL